LVSEPPFYFGRHDNARSVIISPAEPPPEDQDMIILEVERFVGDDLVDVYPIRFGPGQCKSILGFVITVQTIAGK
jgi:hypothetical protein